MKKIVSIVLVALALIVALYSFFTNDAENQSDTEVFYDSSQIENQTRSKESTYQQQNPDYQQEITYTFRNERLLQQHYEKHGIEMGFPDAESYEKAASDVINNKDALHKIEKEDGDDVYYVVSTNELVVLSTDGYIRTYFKPNAGKRYFDRT